MDAPNVEVQLAPQPYTGRSRRKGLLVQGRERIELRAVLWRKESAVLI